MADLTTLDAVLGYLDLSPGSSSEGQIRRLISAESQRFISLTNNAIAQATYTETTDGTGRTVLVPSRYPVASVTSLTIDGNVIPKQTAVGGEGWVLVTDRVELLGYSFTNVRGVVPGYSFGYAGGSGGVGNVTLVYVAGYAAVPADVDQAVCEMVALKMKGRDRIGLMSQSIGGETVSYQTLTLPESIQAVIDNYSRPAL